MNEKEILAAWLVSARVQLGVRVPSQGIHGSDYDPGGAYWGSVRGDWRSGLNALWCAWDSDGEGVFYDRAKDRAEAKRLTLIENPGVTFFR